jgi:hypothetical protein
MIILNMWTCTMILVGSVNIRSTSGFWWKTGPKWGHPWLERWSRELVDTSTRGISDEPRGAGNNGQLFRLANH